VVLSLNPTPSVPFPFPTKGVGSADVERSLAELQLVELEPRQRMPEGGISGAVVNGSGSGGGTVG